MRRETLQTVLADKTLSGPARSVVEARLAWSRSSTAKLTSIASARSADGRVRGCFQYYGARTGRWSGRRVQPQNFYRGSLGVDVPEALGCIAAGADARDLDMLFSDSPLGVVASCLRSTIVAGPGNRLCLADFSQIEARVLAWLAGQEDSLEIFRSGKDIYTETARAIGSSHRQLGKVLVLACGFGMSWVKFTGTARGYGVILTEVEANAAVMAWRAVNWKIVQLWWETHKALLRVTAGGPGTMERCGKCSFIRRADAVLVRLPSGRHLVYRQPKIEENPQGHPEFVYMGGFGGHWAEIRMWPGKLVENITQAVARDIMCDAILSLPDVPLVGTVHDELVAETAEADADETLDRMLSVMRRSPAWAAGLPVNAAGLVTRRYAKG
jgi:DNA polymerase